MIGARQSLRIDFAVTILSEVTSGPRLCQENVPHGRISIWYLFFDFFLCLSFVTNVCIYFSSKKSQTLNLATTCAAVDIYDCPACPELLSHFQQITITELTDRPTVLHMHSSSFPLDILPTSLLKEFMAAIGHSLLNIVNCSLTSAVALIILSKPVFSL